MNIYKIPLKPCTCNKIITITTELTNDFSEKAGCGIISCPIMNS